jgi:ribosomal protein S18 acetylase RimI-like enzyme
VDQIRYAPAEPADVEAIRRFFQESRPTNRAEDPERFRLIVERADRTVVAWEGERVVGFCRALCDGVSNGYVSMVAVALTHKRRGIGREMLKRLMGDDEGITWVLRASDESVPFWQSLGFQASTTAMQKVRRK